MNDISKLEMLDDESVKDADATLERAAMPSVLPPATPPPQMTTTRPMHSIAPPARVGEMTTRYVPSRWRAAWTALRAGGWRRAAGLACVAGGVGVIVPALVMGLSASAPDAQLAPTVAAAMVLGRALVAVAAMALGYALLRTARPLLEGKGDTRSGALALEPRSDLN